jgi:hypothetical protein
VAPALRALVRSSEYEDWPRGRIVFDRARDLFILNSIRLAYIRESGDAISRGFVTGFLNTVRTGRFDRVLAIKALLPAIARAA